MLSPEETQMTTPQIVVLVTLFTFCALAVILKILFRDDEADYDDLF